MAVQRLLKSFEWGWGWGWGGGAQGKSLEDVLQACLKAIFISLINQNEFPWQ